MTASLVATVAAALGFFLLCGLSAAASTMSPYYVDVLPGAPTVSFEQYAGRLPVDDGFGGELFFWMFTMENTTLSTADKSVPLVIWLNGGPGCSSLLGLLSEQGPWRPRPDGSGVDLHNYHWAKASHIVFVDQPVGTGFSLDKSAGGLVRNETEVAADFIRFLRHFYAAFPQLKGNPLAIFGESYAGHYIPLIGTAVSSVADEFTTDFIGVAIGNGWVEPRLQTRAYVDYAYYRGLVGWNELAELEHLWTACEAEAKADAGKSGVAIYNMGSCGKIMETALSAAGNPNQYDVRTYVQYDFLYDTTSGMYRFLNSNAVKTALHLPADASWQCCSDVVGKEMNCDQPLSMLHDLGLLLDQGHRVLLYAGESDYNCNFLGTEALVREIPWKGQGDFNASYRKLWKPSVMGGKNPAGFVNENGPLTLLVISNCGHLVPFDQPESSLDLVQRFVSHRKYADVDV